MRRFVVFGLLLLLAMPAVAVLPDFASVKQAHSRSDDQLFDRHGELIHELRVNSHIRQLEWVALDDISPALKQAVVQAEDRRFYDHTGVDWRALTASAFSLLRGGNPRGASTITMQLAAFLDPSLQPDGTRRKLGQKWRQVQAARELERTWTKEQLLEAYLNLVDFRGELRGVAAAARGLFDKHPSGIEAHEALILAALLRSPNSPPETVAARACALGESLKMPVACDAVARLTRERLLGPFRIRPVVAEAPQVARKLLKPGTVRVVSTLDARLQRFVRQALSQQLAALGEQRVGDGAVLVVDNQSGEVLAYVGNRGDSFVDGVIALRQAGSTLKPFLYELAIERRLLTAASVLDDSPVNLVTPTGLYVPQDYDKDFKGLVSLRTSLASSLNVPAVRTLMLVGTDDFVRRLRRLGFEDLTEDGDFYGYSLALGSGEVSLLQMVNAYRTLANNGMYSRLTLTPRGKFRSVRVLDHKATFIVTDILADRSARSLTFGLENVLATPFWSAVKTGTSKDMRDNWCAGYSDRFTVGVWVGNFNGESMQDVSGITGAAPVWLEIMHYLHQGHPARPPAPPSGVVASNVKFSPGIENERREWFVRGTELSEVRLQDDPDVRHARITYPARGTVLALDPDIPPTAQRVYFEMTPENTNLRWQLNGVAINANDGWRPSGGHHRLTLVDVTGTVQDEVVFEVRGVEL